MQRKFLESILSDIVGKSTLPLIDLLYGQTNVNEFLIAKKLNLTINQTRNLLYRLADFGLVSSTRKKDRRKGWYTYFWTLELGKSFELLGQLLEKKIVEVRKEISTREQQRFYLCENCHIEYLEEDALLKDFICPECGSVLALKDNNKLIADFKKQLLKLSHDLQIIREKITEEQAIVAKKRERKERKEKKAKEKFRAEKRKAAQKLKKKEKIKIKKRSIKKSIKKKKHTKKSKLIRKKRR